MLKKREQRFNTILIPITFGLLLWALGTGSGIPIAECWAVI